MKVKITQKQAEEIISQCKAIIIDDDLLCYPSLDIEDDETWLYLSWDDDDFSSLSFVYDNQDIFFDGNTLYMQDKTGNEWEVKLLINMESCLTVYSKITIEDFKQYVAGWLISTESPNLDINNMKAALHNALNQIEDDQDGIVAVTERFRLYQKLSQ